MAPEILNYIPGFTMGRLSYTNAVDIWALGCIIYRLVAGVVPFPLGPSLGKFCEDESTFPLQPSALSELGYNLVRQLLVADPSQRLTVRQALDHEWTQIGKNHTQS